MRRILPFRQGEAGFTLAEVAIALCVIATVIGLLVPALLSMRVAEQSRATGRQLEAVMQAVAAYVQANGCVPCPASPTSPEANRGLVGTGAACGVCNASIGLVPYRSLGISEKIARDGYGNWFTYAVDTNLAVNFGVIPPFAPCQTGDTNPPCSATDIASARRKKGLCKESLTAINPTGLTTLKRPLIMLGGGVQRAAVVIVSHGANGWGAYRETPSLRKAFPPGIPQSCTANRDNRPDSEAQFCNASNNIDNFTIVAAGANSFDDQLLYLNRNALVSYMGGGSACQASDDTSSNDTR